MLNKRRHRLIGMQCSNWGAGICGTDDCGVRCLRLGRRQTFFDQWGKSFMVDSSFLTDHWGRRVGHIEVVQDMTQHISLRRKQVETIEKLDMMTNLFASDSRSIGEESQMLASAFTQQGDTLDGLSRAIDTLSEETKGNTAKAESARALASSIKENADRGTGKMAELMKAAKTIQKANKNIGKAIRQIDTIASQTNMLALNAAIEASKAGAHGKGFAVVAEEVSKLASKCAKAAENTNDLVVDSIEMTDLGARIASEADASFADIVKVINESETITREIVDASGAQGRAIVVVSDGVKDIRETMKSNSDTAGGLADTGRDISDQVGQLTEIIAGLQKSLKK
jgi:methyl-accepting chemotaxis protein